MSLPALLIGFAIGAIVFSVLMLVVVRNVRKGLADDMAAKDRALDESRREAAEDRETNRRLRHEIHQLQHGYSDNLAQPSAQDLSHGGLVGQSSADQSWKPASPVLATVAPDVDAQVEIAALKDDLEDASLQIAAGEAKLKRYREALTEIRESLEARDPLASLVHITEEVPTTPPADASSGAA